MTTSASVGIIPPKCQIIEVRVAERQLFNAIDPSSFRERDVDPRAREFIVDRSRDLPSDAPLALVVHPGGRGEKSSAEVIDSLHQPVSGDWIYWSAKGRELIRGDQNFDAARSSS